MIRRSLLYIGVLGAAIGVPYGLSNPDWSSTLGDAWRSWTASGGDGAKAENRFATGPAFGAGVGASPGYASAPTAATPHAAALPPPSLEGWPVQDMAEVFRFDVTPQWVAARWARVSTTLSDLDLEGFRVPLVTGTRQDDLAGSLTYYFDKQQTVQRITFEGSTGDASRLAALVTQHYGMRPEPSLGAGLYLARWNGKPTNALRVRHAAVIRAGAPQARLDVMLELNRPGARFGLSKSFDDVLAHDRGARAW